MDRFKNVLIFAGLGCFALAFVLSSLYPWMITDARHLEATIEEVTREVSPDFKALKESYPVVFGATFEGAGETKTDQELALVAADDPARAASDRAWHRAYADAVRKGRDIYVAEACWHCHSQYVRPVANETLRFGRVQKPEHDNNALQRPVLWGTRRVGPDLTHEGGLRSNDWHVAHFFNPRSTSPGSVMPAYRWFLREGWVVARKIDPDVAEREGLSKETSYPYPGLYDTKEQAEAALPAVRETIPVTLAGEKQRLFVRRARGPNHKGLAVIAYLQWLGTWEPKSKSAN